MSDDDLVLITVFYTKPHSVSVAYHKRQTNPSKNIGKKAGEDRG
jgi:hypothetical protein